MAYRLLFFAKDDCGTEKGHNCSGSGNAAGQGVFQRYKLSRRDGLHWSFARCAQMPDAESLARWEKLRTAQLERMRAKAEKQAAEK